jgi:hypothetical protein
MSLRTYTLALALILTGLAAAQDAPPIQPPPTLEPAKVQALQREIEKLRNNSAEGRAKTEAVVIEYGRGAIPFLVAEGHTRHEGQQAGLVNCLLALAASRPHTRDPLARLRVRCPPARGRLGRRRQLDALPPPWDADQAGARRCGGGHGREDYRWPPRATGAARAPRRRHPWQGASEHRRAGHRPQSASARRRRPPGSLTAVDVLYAIATTPVTLLWSALDDHHNLVQRSAINALRDLLEQQGPMVGSSIFQQIKEVERLKEVYKQPR